LWVTLVNGKLVELNNTIVKDTLILQDASNICIDCHMNQYLVMTDKKLELKNYDRSVSNKGLFVTNYRGMLRNCDIPLLLHCL
jgi:hypothetical protein